MNFLIQTIDGKVKHDFSFTLIQSLDYHNWINNDKKAKYRLVNDLSKVNKPYYTPIGSVEFVSEYLQKFYGIQPKPLNVPDDLNQTWITHRHIINGTDKDISGQKFAKSNDKIKGITGLCSDCLGMPEGNYQISDVIDIVSEWRCFVYDGKLVGLSNYSGDFTLFPSIWKINEMINAYKSAPIAYTLDVGINVYSDGNEYTFVIECHEFFSCGLYGFADHKILPIMFIRAFNEIIKKYSNVSLS